VKLLAFDTATDLCSVAVWIDGRVHERSEIGARHSERLLLLIDETLAETGVALHGLDVIAFGRGPGSFTGLRISAGVAQGLAFGADLPVVPVSTLATLAQSLAAERVLAALDARMQQVYWGAYRRNSQGVMELCGDEVVIAPAEVPVPGESGWVGAGSGWDQYTAALRSRLHDRVERYEPNAYPRAGALAKLGAVYFDQGAAVAAGEALPVYIRDNVAKKAAR
jgi:tRNA threonylcarbamoyladenosine biosynthesis protein TsaB